MPSIHDYMAKEDMADLYADYLASLSEEERREATRDPLTECPECDGSGYIPECCGHATPATYWQPAECCGNYDAMDCPWCAENDKSAAGKVPPEPRVEQPDDDLPF